MSVRLSAFPKCYLDKIAGDRSMTIFEWIEMARQLDADGLEMYDGFFTSWETDYMVKVAEALEAAGFVMPMLCCSPDFTNPDADQRRLAIEQLANRLSAAHFLGGPGRCAGS